LITLVQSELKLSIDPDKLKLAAIEMDQPFPAFEDGF
jgi:hypothetical protein